MEDRLTRQDVIYKGGVYLSTTRDPIDESKNLRQLASQYGVFAILVVSFVVAYLPVLQRLVSVWNSSEEYSHGFFIIPISLYIMWGKKDVLATVPMRPSLWGGVLIAVSLLFYMLSHMAEILTLAPITMISCVAGIVIFCFGFPLFNALSFPICFLFFMIPIPSQIYAALTVPLQLFVTKVSVGIGGLWGIPIYREGNVIHIPDHTLQVVAACSGLRSMIALLTLSAIFGYITLRSNLLRVILFFSGVPVAIFVNIIRVFLMIAAFYYFNYDLAEGSVHTAFGMGIFVLALVTIVLIKGVLAIWEK